MKRPTTLIFLLIFLFIGITSLKAQQPNIIIIYTDDMGLGDVSFTGGAVYDTPNINRLAESGKIFTQYYTPAPVCSPSRVNLTTGMYHIRWNINTYLDSRAANDRRMQQDYLSSDAPTMAKTLKAAGYTTAHIGKWHLGGGRDVTDAPSITQYGFDEYVSTYESPDPDPAITSTNWIWAMTDDVKRWDRTAYFVDKTIDFLKSNPDKPCFINLWPDDVHTPWVPSMDVPSSSYEALSSLQPVIGEYDKQIGRLLDELETMGILDNTLIVFTSDNGPSPTFTQSRSNSKRGAKNSIYEAGVNMPFVISWPGKIPAGVVDENSVISSLDLFPTLCKIAGTEYPSDFDGDGEDISDCFLSNTEHQRQEDLFFEYGRNPSFNFPIEVNRSLHLGIRHDKWKLYTSADGFRAELYDLSVDPNETNDLSDTETELVNTLKTKVINWYFAKDMEFEETVKTMPDPTPKELVFYCPFDESVNDMSENDYVLNNVNNVPLVEGKYGNAASFNGTNQYLDLNVTGLVNPGTDQFTFCTWVRNEANIPASNSTIHLIIGQKDNNGTGRVFAQSYVYSDGNETYNNFLGGALNGTIKTPYPKGDWVHLAITCDPGYDSVAYYVNGAQIMKIQAPNFENCTGALRIGAHKSKVNYWKGEFDEMFLFKGILNPDEIQDVMNNITGPEIIADRNSTSIESDTKNANDFYVIYDEEARLLSFKYNEPISELSLYSITGRKIVSTDKIWPINTTRLTSGTYIIKMTDAKGTNFSRKVLIN
nr:sulfatase-like hydrolase/transferase [uncultured Carboxylicivirga sp.]